jgi:hypothetical protein
VAAGAWHTVLTTTDRAWLAATRRNRKIAPPVTRRQIDQRGCFRGIYADHDDAAAVAGSLHIVDLGSLAGP